MEYNNMVERNSSFFHSIDNEVKAYWLGFFCADGHLYKSGKQISILLSRKDKKHLQKFGRIFAASVKDGESKDKRTGKIYRNSRCVISCKEICCDLKDKHLDNHKTQTLNRYVFKSVPIDLINHFIRGYFDGDGCISQHYKKEFAFNINGTKSFLSEILEIFQREIGIGNSTVAKNVGVYNIDIGGNWQILKIKEWMYKNANIFLERKKKLFDKIKFGGTNKTSPYRGVGWNIRDQKWKARIFVNSRNMWLGTFNNEEDAAKAYDNAIEQFKLPLYKKNF